MTNQSGIIYVTQNLLNGKIYIGIHTKGRSSYLGSGKYLQRAIKKYGQEHFRRIDIDEFNSIEEGCCKERFWICELNSKVPNGYNLNDGGEGQFNPCQEVRDRMSEGNKGDKSPMRRPEVAAKHSRALMGKPSGMKDKHHNNETKIRMSIVHKGKFHRKETKDKLSELNKGKYNPMFGKHHSDKTKTKMSKSQMGKHFELEGIR
jgi:hypothetical protein